jgi:hypothetical protein
MSMSDQIARLIVEYEAQAAVLHSEMAADERRHGISDPANYAYPTYATAARGRRDNLRASIAVLKSRLAAEAPSDSPVAAGHVGPNAARRVLDERLFLHGRRDQIAA